MNAGAFSVSLNVKDIRHSKAFYEKLGFEVAGGDLSQNWLIMRSGEAVIGLFQGMFDRNILTFNPGWNQQGEEADTYTDVRVLQETLRNAGVYILSEVSTGSSGPGCFLVEDPDGNPILVDQHR